VQSDEFVDAHQTGRVPSIKQLWQHVHHYIGSVPALAGMAHADAPSTRPSKGRVKRNGGARKIRSGS
jgi:hypothetical protein